MITAVIHLMIKLLEYSIPREVAESIPAGIAHCYEVVPIAFGRPPRSIVIATPNELDANLKSEFREHTGLSVCRQGITAPHDFFCVLNSHYPNDEAIQWWARIRNPEILTSPAPIFSPLSFLHMHAMAIDNWRLLKIIFLKHFGKITFVGLDGTAQTQIRSLLATNVLVDYLTEVSADDRIDDSKIVNFEIIRNGG